MSHVGGVLTVWGVYLLKICLCNLKFTFCNYNTFHIVQKLKEITNILIKNKIVLWKLIKLRYKLTLLPCFQNYVRNCVLKRLPLSLPPPIIVSRYSVLWPQFFLIPWSLDRVEFSHWHCPIDFPTQVLATAADPNIGGRDFDRALLYHFSEEFKVCLKHCEWTVTVAWLIVSGIPYFSSLPTWFVRNMSEYAKVL